MKKYTLGSAFKLLSSGNKGKPLNDKQSAYVLTSFLFAPFRILSLFSNKKRRVNSIPSIKITALKDRIAQEKINVAEIKANQKIQIAEIKKIHKERVAEINKKYKEKAEKMKMANIRAFDKQNTENKQDFIK